MNRLVTLAIPLLFALVSCASAVTGADEQAGVRPFTVEPVPREERYVVAVPRFTVGAWSVRSGQADLATIENAAHSLPPK